MYQYRNRKSNRLKNFNYSNDGYYFVTICVKYFIPFFGEIKNKKIILNKYGKIANNLWLEIPNHYANVNVDKFIIMPNHVHGIIKITKNNNINMKCVGTEYYSVPTKTNTKNYGLLSKIIKSYKHATTKQIRNQYHEYLFQWQRSYYDHIIRDKYALHRIREYIHDNPSKWQRDRNNKMYL